MSTTPVEQALDGLEQKVTSLTDVVAAMKQYITGLADLIKANANAPQRIQQIADKVQADIDDITGAITANTPSEPT